jgi:hypothetical protein
VRVTSWPENDGFGDANSAVVLAALLTVRVVALFVALLKLVSPG